jgi:uncharacterized membrane protein YfcA
MLVLIAVIAAISALYAMAGQAGGTAFVAVMALAGFPAAEMRPTALLLNIVAASYATWTLHRKGLIDWQPFIRLIVASLPAAFLGGLVVLEGRLYFVLTGSLLLLAAALMVLKRSADTAEDRQPPLWPAALGGAAVGFLSGVSGIGGGVFLAPLLIVLGWSSPKQAAYLSAPFILLNSVLGSGGVWLAGQTPSPGAALYALGALAGSVIGTAISLRWMSERVIRYVLSAILVFAGFRLLLG